MGPSGRDLLKQAEKTLSSTGSFWNRLTGSEETYRSAAEGFIQAAEKFLQEGLYIEAGNAFKRGADTFRNHLEDSSHSTGPNYKRAHEAFMQAYRGGESNRVNDNVALDGAKECATTMGEIFKEKRDFPRLSKAYVALGDLYREQLNDVIEAEKWYLNAFNLYFKPNPGRPDKPFVDSPSIASGYLNQVADMLVDHGVALSDAKAEKTKTGDYFNRAASAYQMAATIIATERAGVIIAKPRLFNSGLCLLAIGDAAELGPERFLSSPVFNTTLFNGGGQATLLRDLAAAINQKVPDLEQFVACMESSSKVMRMEPRHVNILSVARRVTWGDQLTKAELEMEGKQLPSSQQYGRSQQYDQSQQYGQSQRYDQPLQDQRNQQTQHHQQRHIPDEQEDNEFV